MALLAELFAFPFICLNLKSELRALALVARMLEELVDGHALEALCWSFCATLRASNTGTTNSHFKGGLGVFKIGDIDTSLAINHLVRTMCHKNEVLLDIR
jgi:hypothetical protein